MDSTSDNPGRDAAPRSPGAILATERERQGLSRADIAQRLHMSASQVEALEASDYGRLPRGTFLRGFARNYARSLGLDPEPIVGLLVEDAPRARSPAIVVPRQTIRCDPRGPRLSSPYVKAAGIAAAVIVLGFAVMYWWLFVRPQNAATATPVKKPAIEASKVAQSPPVEAPKAESPPPGEESPAVQGSSSPVPPMTGASTPAVPVPASAPAVTPPAPAPAPAQAAPVEQPRVPGPGESIIRLSFRAAAWVEIADARGKPMLSRTHAGGSTAEVIGKPPFTLVIGNAPEVRLTYNGREVDLAPHTRVAVARFTLP